MTNRWVHEDMHPHLGQGNPATDTNRDAYTNIQLQADAHVHLLDMDIHRGWRPHVPWLAYLVIVVVLAAVVAGLTVLYQSRGH